MRFQNSFLAIVVSVPFHFPMCIPVPIFLSIAMALWYLPFSVSFPSVSSLNICKSFEGGGGVKVGGVAKNQVMDRYTWGGK